MSRSELAMWDWIYLSPLMMMLNQYYDMPLNEFYLLVCATASFFFIFILSTLPIFMCELIITIKIRIHNFLQNQNSQFHMVHEIT